MESLILLVGINTVIGLASGAYNIAYFLTHENGKKWFRLVCGLVIMGLGASYAAMIAGVLPISLAGQALIQPWITVLFLIPAYDARIDWHRRAV